MSEAFAPVPMPPDICWARLRCRVWALQPAWPPVLIVGLYALLLFGADQVRDCALGAVLDWRSVFGRALTFALWNVLFGLAVWFSARLLMTQQRHLPGDLACRFTQESVVAEMAGSVRWLARLSGAAIPLVSCAAFLLACHEALSDCHIAPALDQSVAAVIVIVFAWKRRDLARRFMPRMALFPALSRWKHPFELGWPTLRVCAAWAAGALICLVWAIADPVGMGQSLGPFSVLTLGLIGICFGLTALAFLQRVWHVPTFAIVLALALVSSYFADNHGLPELTPPSIPPVTLQQAYKKFMAQPAPHRLLLVATAGGGIRAAFWTAYALGQLHDRAGAGFDNALFSISGVSGGGVGAVFYRAMLAEQENRLPICTRSDNVPHTLIAECAEHYLGQDGIGPTLTALLFPDLVQRFIPIPILPDRAAALAASWSDAWAKDARSASGYMTGPLAALWRPERPWPILLLNGTSVAQGHRILTSNLDLTDPPDEFHDVQAFPHGYTISAAVAGLNTARFPVVSPPGGIPAQGGMPADQIVDGGVFENSGAETTLELLQWIEDQHDAGQPDIGILQITSDPDEAPGPPKPCVPAPPPRDEATAPKLLPDVLSGLTALFRSRGARGIAEMAALRVAACNAHLHYAAIRLQKIDNRPEPPLGWSLSGAAIEAIKNSWPAKQPKDPINGNALNGQVVQAMLAWLQGA